MSGRRLLVFAIALTSVALSSEWGLLTRLAYLLWGLTIAAWLWSWLSVRGVQVDRRPETDRLTAGETLREQLTIVNRWPWPRLWLAVQAGSDLPGYQSDWVGWLGPWGRRSWTSHTVCRRRGLYRLGPVWLTGADPGGFFPRRRRMETTATVLVYPPVLPLDRPPLPTTWLPQADRLVTLWPAVSPLVAGVREYRPGDSLRYVHWPATARHQRFIVKEFEPETAADLWLVLDGEATAQAGQDEASTEEYAVRAAAALAGWALARRRAVGLLATGEPGQCLEPSAESGQDDAVLTALALFRSTGQRPLAQVLAQEHGRFRRASVVLVITASAAPDWPAVLADLRAAGRLAGAIYLDPASFGAAVDPGPVLTALQRASLPHCLVRRGDDLATALTDWSPGGRG